MFISSHFINLVSAESDVLNEINEAEVWDLIEYIKYFKAKSRKKLLIYTNGWIYDFIAAILKSNMGKVAAQAWLDDQIWWIAGGAIYNQKLYALPSNEYDPFPHIPWTILQFSADKNEMADELDFSDHEREDIDYNRVRMSPLQLREFFNASNDQGVSDDPMEAIRAAMGRANARIAALEKTVTQLVALVASGGLPALEPVPVPEPPKHQNHSQIKQSERV